ncbi:DUF4231 domain-containing protein [Mycoplasmopsis pullorum]|uniref:DUF4231 domain-containing protein n=1 Tax=Mycoplasmopsis pullorum TaxID=48003 RepID=A0A1L4FRY2_9BACT|nr:DUF4231 domain-containing protein [Mycoplasmopsis pullorum]APJ38377.1 hypothetical protein BLA55_01665 [Mycoplasmopsis pullorum]
MLKIDRFFQKRRQKAVLNKYLLGTLYYSLNLITIASSTFLGIAVVLFLAGNNKWLGQDNPYRTFLNDSTLYIILTAIINAGVSFISGILSFFVVGSKFEDAKTNLKRIDLEYILFKGKELYYSPENTTKPEYVLYKRILYIISFDRYQRESLIKESAKNEQSQ